MTGRTALFLLATLVASARPVSSLGVGVSAGTDALGGVPGGAVMLSIHIPGLPVMWGAGAQIDQQQTSFVGTADLWLAGRGRPGSTAIYVAPGLYLALPNPTLFGLRLPVGVDTYVRNSLELFAETAPTFILFSSGATTSPSSFRLQVTGGARLWF